MSYCWFIFCSAWLLITSVFPAIWSLMLGGSVTFLMMTAVISTPWWRVYVCTEMFWAEEGEEEEGGGRRDQEKLARQAAKNVLLYSSVGLVAIRAVLDFRKRALFPHSMKVSAMPNS